MSAPAPSLTRRVPSQTDPRRFPGVCAATALLVLAVVFASAATAARPAARLSEARATELITEVARLIQQHGYPAPDPAALGAAAKRSVSTERSLHRTLDAMAASVDDESLYLSESEYQELVRAAPEKSADIGVELYKNGDRVLLCPLPGSPAENAGLSCGAELEAVDGRAAARTRVPDLMRALRGPVLSPVALTVTTGGHSEQHLLHRRYYRPRYTVVSLQGGKYLYIRLGYLTDATRSELLRGIEHWPRVWRGVILDLRNSSGGVLASAAHVSDLFLRQGVIGRVVAGAGRRSRVARASPNDATWKELESVPMVVVVNEWTSSSSELIAAALQDRKRAQVFGRATRGSGMVQSLLPLEGHGALKITSGEMLRPNGARLQGRGVTPDLPAPAELNCQPIPIGERVDPCLARAAEHLDKMLE